MFVLDLTYTAPTERVDEVLPDHVVWLDAHYAAGDFLMSGRKSPRDGGIIIAAATDRAAAEAIAASDPFTTAGVADYRIIEFLATKTAPELAPHRQQLPS